MKLSFKYHSFFSFSSSYRWTWTFVISMFDGHFAIILTSFDQFLLIKFDLLGFKNCNLHLFKVIKLPFKGKEHSI